MTDEKPLHVRVAEALGWTDCREIDTLSGDWLGRQPRDWSGVVPQTITEIKDKIITFQLTVPHFDTSWAVTGPLIERYAIQLLTMSGDPSDEYRWRANQQRAHQLDPPGFGRTPLIAVCNLILALKAAGNL